MGTASGNAIKRQGADFKYYLIIAICVALMFFGGYIPPFAPEITRVGMQIIGIFVGMVVLWSTVGGVIWPSLLAVVALGVSDYTNMAGAVASALGTNIIWQVLMCVTLTYAITQSGAGEYLARWLISRKFLQGRPYLFSMMYMIGFMFIAALTSGIGMMLLSWAILRGIASILNADMKEGYFVQMSIYLMTSCCLGEFMIPFKSWVAALWNSFGNVVGMSLNYIPYLLVTMIFGLVIIAIMTALLKVTRVDMSRLLNFDNSQLRNTDGSAPDRLNERQLSYLVVMLICMGGALLSSILPKDTAIYALFNRFTAGGLFTLGVAYLSIKKAKDGKPLMDFKQVMSAGTVWGPLLLIAAAIPIANALCSEATGFMAWVTNVLNPIFESSPTIVIYIVIILACVILTNLGSNTGIAMMMLPIAVPLALSAGANMYAVGICVIYSACFRLVLPGASAMAAMVYGVGDHLSVKDIIKYTSIICVVYIILAIPVFTLLNELMIL